MTTSTVYVLAGSGSTIQAYPSQLHPTTSTGFPGGRLPLFSPANPLQAQRRLDAARRARRRRDEDDLVTFGVL